MAARPLRAPDERIEGSAALSRLAGSGPSMRRPRKTDLDTSRRIAAARNAIERTLTHDIPIAYFANRAGMTWDSFTRKFRAAYGAPPATYRLQARLKMAEDLLIRDPEAEVRQVAQACGFTNASFFFREFRKRYGRTPGELRLSAGTFADRQEP